MDIKGDLDRWWIDCLLSGGHRLQYRRKNTCLNKQSMTKVRTNKPKYKLLLNIPKRSAFGNLVYIVLQSI